MKKIIAILLAAIMCFSLVSCGNKRAFELTQNAFFEISKSVDILKQISNDIISAWTIGIYDESTLKHYGDGFDWLCENVSLSKDDMLDGLAYYKSLDIQPEYVEILCDPELGLYNDYYEYYKEAVRKFYDAYFYGSYEETGILNVYDKVFSGCVMLVVYSYEANGKLSEIEQSLTSAEAKIKDLSNKHSNYEHYENIKEYYSTARTMYNFCKLPTGTLEQAKSNINDYKNTADSCYNSMYYFFQ